MPHYDNKEGATHDTRFCYLGEERLTALEAELPDHVGVLGVDEHTAMLIDVEARTMTVAGNGVVSVRRRGDTRTFAAGESLTLDVLSAMLRGEQSAAPAPARCRWRQPHPSTTTPATSLRAEADRAREAFEAALGRRDVDGCVAAVLGLEEAIAAWQADTLQSDDADEARRVLRALVVRLGELAEQGAADPADAVAPFVEALLAVRTGARENKDFATSDLVRDRLVAAGVEVRDAPDGTSWTLTRTPDPLRRRRRRSTTYGRRTGTSRGAGASQGADWPAIRGRLTGAAPRVGGMATHWTLGGDATDPHRLAAFWALALGYIAEPGYDFEGGASIVDPDGVGPAIGFLQVPEAKAAKNRFHIDIRVAGGRPVDPAQHEQWVRAKSAELVGAGATVVREDAYDGQFSHIVMLDPEGNEFCVA